MALIILKITPLILLLMLTFCSYYFHGRMRFGYGLGDVFYYIVLWLATIFYIAIYIIIRTDNSESSYFFPPIFTIVAVFLILKMSIWRGSESPWNGDIFS